MHVETWGRERDDALSRLGRRGHRLFQRSGTDGSTAFRGFGHACGASGILGTLDWIGWGVGSNEVPTPQPGLLCQAPVVKLQVLVTRGLLVRSLMAAFPPRKVTVKLVFARRFAAGVIDTV